MADILARQRTIHGSTADWAANNLVIGNGEIAVERRPDGTVRAKVGNGTATFSALPYLSGALSITYKGAINAVTTDPPVGAVVGDMWSNTGSGAVKATWGAPVAGQAIQPGDQLTFNGSVWQLIPAASDISGTIARDGTRPPVAVISWGGQQLVDVAALGIGTPTPLQKLHVQFDVDGAVAAFIRNTHVGGGATAGYTMETGSPNHVCTYDVSDANHVARAQSGSAIVQYQHNHKAHQFLTDGVTRAYIANNGNVAIGPTTAPAEKLDVYGNVQLSGDVLRIKTRTANGRGWRITDQSTGTTLGAFSVHGSFDDWATIHRGFAMDTSGNFQPSVDNAGACGQPASRWTAIYAVNGSIQTSDEREKTWRGAATADELEAARRIIAELGFYQFNDAVAEKGTDGARYHFGTRAQRVWAIMAHLGLVDPIGADGSPGPNCPYAFLCYDAWEPEFDDVMEPVLEPQQVTDPETGEISTVMVDVGNKQPTGERIQTRAGGNRYGVRPDELNLFLIAAQEARLAALEAAAP